MRMCFLLVSLALRMSAADLYFLQMSDPQFGMFTADKGFVQETANFEFAIATANRLKPAFVVITGDLINKAGDAAQLAEYKRISGHLDPAIKLYSVAGNHDVENEPRPASLAAYRRNIGPDYYAFRQGDLLGIVLNSSLIQHPDKAPEEAARQEAWLRSELEKADREGVPQRVIFQHISYFLEKPEEPDQYFNIPIATRRRYLELFEKYGVTAIFAGHYHRNALGQVGKIPMITTGPVGMPLGQESSGMRVVKLANGKLEHTYYGLGNLPKALE